MHDCDVMINIGARFDDRVTGRLNAFSPGSKKIHVDIDPSSINKSVRVDIPVVGDVGHVVEEMMRIWKARQIKTDAEGALATWWDQINKWRAPRLPEIPSRPTRSSSRNSRWSASMPRSRTRISTSRRKWASTRCGRPSS